MLLRFCQDVFIAVLDSSKRGAAWHDLAELGMEKTPPTTVACVFRGLYVSTVLAWGQICHSIKDSFTYPYSLYLAGRRTVRDQIE
jgi:hypothetical protein